MTSSERLLAKSQPKDGPPHPSAWLPQHLRDVATAARMVVDATGVDQLRALGLEPGRYWDRLRRCVLLAAAVHDLGKANDHFQGMIRNLFGRRDRPQGLRHEWVTVLILQWLKKWLLPAVAGSEIDFAIVEWAVAGHHPGHDRASPPSTCPAGAGPELNVFAGHGDVCSVLAWMKDDGDFQLADDPPQLVDWAVTLTGAGNVFSELTRWAKAALKVWDGMNPEDRRFVAAVKDSLIAADVAGSALPKEETDEARRWRWIADSFAALPTGDELRQILEARARSFQESDPDQDRFQAEVAAAAGPVTFVKAGCGTGKTFAAYKWAATHHAGRRLFFCYPTTGTATEGFRDYLYEPDVRADLFHSRRDVDFDIILTTGRDSSDADRDAAVRVESLDLWATPIVACTVDTVLGIVQNNKRGRFSWPALAQSAFIFDEIHAYDDLLFGALLRFLRDLPGLPALLMTASLPKAREEVLRETLRCRSGSGVELAAIPGPKSLEDLPRYHKAQASGNDPLALVKESLAQRGKVLWVCNTVGRVMEAARRTEAIGLKPLVYHSRFRYEDRVERHGKVIEAFQPHNGACIVICSQVAEMSLDLSADLLITDLAPVPSLIQRLGRLNRRARKHGDRTKPFVVVDIDIEREHLPYTPADLKAAQSWLSELSCERISQRDLVQRWDQAAENLADLVSSTWLDGGPTTAVREIRNASRGISVILNTRDYPDYYRLIRYDERVRRIRKRAQFEGRKPTSEETKPRDDERRLGAVILPMPPASGDGWKRWTKYNGIPVAPEGAVIYCPMRGAIWNA